MSIKASKTVITLTLIGAVSTWPVMADEIAQDASKNVEKSSHFCTYSKRTPIIPDGNIATKDELLNAKERISEYQDQMNDYRDCLYSAETALDSTVPNYEEQKVAIQKLSDESIEVEQKVADEFNQAIRIFKQR